MLIQDFGCESIHCDFLFLGYFARVFFNSVNAKSRNSDRTNVAKCNLSIKLGSGENDVRN